MKNQPQRYEDTKETQRRRFSSSFLRVFVPSWFVLLSSFAHAGDIGFVEEFALAKDRTAALKQLIPGTEDYYFYHCLHFQNKGQFDKVEPMIKPWVERFGRTPRLTEIETRQALLTYDRDSKKTLDYLRNHLNLRFDHAKQITDRPPDLPTALDQNLIARSKLLADSLNRGNNLDNFENSAFDWLAAENLGWERRRLMLQRLERPDIPNLPRLIAEDLNSPRAGEFGAYPIHRQLTLAQMEELLRLRPTVLNQLAFVYTWLTKLQPNADEDWQRDPAKTQAYLDRLLGFVRRLAPIHNSLKGHVLYHRLVLDHSRGIHNKELFIEYLKVPRRLPYVSKALIESNEAQRFPMDINADERGVTLMPPIHVDEPLVRAYLKHFFATAQSPREFEPYINDEYLRRLFAETKIENGEGDPEQWASQLPPDQFRQLKDRIDIDFAATNKTGFGADEPVSLDLLVKNVPTLIVKVFEINTKNYYRENKRDVDTDINLDGLVANSETTHSYSEPPLRRMPRHFDFPQLTKPGVYVIDFIGGGRSSRALIRKGRLRPLVTTTTAGHSITVVNDANQRIKDAAVWLSGQEYKAEADGTILVPFTTQPGRQPIVISRGDFACLDYLDHQPERYELKAGIYVDRESLLAQRVANVLVRPGLYLNGIPVSLKLLEEVKLRIMATDLDGIPTSTEVPNFKIFEDREATYEFRVPPRLAQVTFTLEAKVKSLIEGKPIDVAAHDAFSLNGFNITEQVDDLHLAKFGNDFVIEVLGRTGEPRPDRSVPLELKHRDFKERVKGTLKSDAKGQIRLGPLSDIEQIWAWSAGEPRVWRPATDAHTYRQMIHAKAGESITLAYVGKMDASPRDEIALFEVRVNTIRSDRLDAVFVKDGVIELRGLTPGDYELWLKRSHERIHIRVVDGPVVAGSVLGQLRHMQLPTIKSVQVASIATDADAITVKLRDHSAFARVHVLADRYLAGYPAIDHLGQIRDAELGGMYPSHADSTYISGRNIGDEYRYVLDRRNQKKYPGNMLDRPEILLNPWAVRTTETGEQLAQAGEEYRRKGVPAPSAPAAPRDQRTPILPAADRAHLTECLDFLADAAAVLVNLVPDKDGVVKIPRDKLGPHSMVHIVAVDLVSTTVKSVALPETPLRSLDLRLRAGLDPKAHFTQQKQVNILAAGQPFILADSVSSRFEAYDSVAKMYSLFTTLTRDPKLAEFSFITNWPNLKPEEKQAKYSKYACHELSFFLFKRDPEFFRTVVKPYLANKKDKTFLDHWLLESDLKEFAQPWQFGRLNIVERVLLAQRLPNEPAKTSRHISDLLRLLPPNLDRSRILFETAIKESELAESNALRGHGMAKSIYGSNLAADRDAAAALPAPSGGAGGGGNRPGPAGRPQEAPAKSEAPAGEKKSTRGVELKSRDGSNKDKEAYKDAAIALLEADRGEAQGRENVRLGKVVQQLYRKVDATQEWAENNYYHLPIQQQIADLIGVSQFWLDYSKHDGKSPFLSKSFADASRNFTEVMFALAVVDLPFAAGKHDVKFDGAKMTFTPAGPVIAFHEEVRPANPAPDKSPVLVSQNFYRQGDRYREENGEKIDKFVSGEFVVHTVYGCQIVVTNPSAARQRLAVLIQSPVGAVPVANGQFTRTVQVDLEPYHTQTIDYLFYFPAPGKFAHFPVHVAKNETLVASTPAVTFEVVAKPSKLDTESWDYVSQNGTNEQVLAMLGRENVNALDLDKIAFRMKDAGFFTAVTQLLQDRHVYQPTLWSYAILHNVLPAAREFLQHTDQITGECGGPIVSTLLTLDPVKRHTYEHLEYKPLVNARAHSLGDRRQIVNARVLEQYHRFMDLLCHHSQLSDDDRLAIVYYLLLQDRIDEAMATFATVDAEKIATRLQYDYCSAYLDMFNDQPAKARSLAAKYANHPVDRWRNAFANIAAQLDEIEGKVAKAVDAADRNQRQGQAAAKEPSFDFTVEGKSLQLTWQNIEAVRVNYYLMDVELLFSRNPFVQQTGGQFAFIKPNGTQDVQLAAGQNKMTMSLPDNLIKRNVLVEITAAGKTRSQPYYANAMDVKMTENFGQLRVTDAASGKALAKVYVKTYARLADGQVKFYKDGYTDLRGRFDYASVSTPERIPVQRFAVLVLSEDHGATIREAAPPLQPTGPEPVKIPEPVMP
jgi:hypothetical protein